MGTKPNPIREGFHTVTPSLTILGAAEAIEFYKRAFGAVECYRLNTPDDKIAHAEIKIGNSMVFLCDEMPAWGCVSAKTLGGSPVGLTLYVEDVDALVQQAVSAGATLEFPITDQPWGDRSGAVRDPYGFRWGINTQVELVSNEEIERRMAAFFSGKDWRAEAS